MLNELQAQVHPGEGVVAGYGSSLLVAAPRSPEHETLVDEVMAILAAAGGDAEPGRKLARQVAGVIARADDVPSFCMIADVAGGCAVLLHGDLEVEVSGASGKDRFSGREVATWVDRIIDGPIESLVVMPVGTTGSEPDRRSDLRYGVVQGAGLTLAPRAGAAAPAPAPAPVVDTDETAPQDPIATAPAPGEVPMPEPASEFISVSLTDPVDVEPLEPLPVADSPAAVEEPEPGAPEVQGILCSRQHFNDPAALYCSSCGISMVQQTHNIVRRPRPPLGVLVLDDGATFALDGGYVIGREPEQAEEVVAGEARPLALPDPDRTISRVHARVLLHGWDVRISDAESANGTFLAQPGDQEWTRLGQGESVTVRPGARVLVGNRTFVFDSHHKK